MSNTRELSQIAADNESLRNALELVAACHDGEPPSSLRHRLPCNAALYRQLTQLGSCKALGGQGGAAAGERLAENTHAGALFPLALSLAVLELVPRPSEFLVLLGNALRRAVACQWIGERAFSLERPQSFALGMSLELGTLLAVDLDPFTALAIASSPAELRVAQERVLGPGEHCHLGAEAVRRQGWSEELALAIEHHHDALPPQSALARCAWVGERVAAVLESADPDPSRALAQDAFAQVGLGSVEELLDAMPALVQEVATAVGRDIGPCHGVSVLQGDATTRLAIMSRRFQQLMLQLEERSELARQLEASNRELQHLATTDALTGLPNRRLFESVLERDVARAIRQSDPLSLALVDIDHFKLINDRHGHHIGDLALQAVGAELGRCTRTSDLAARYGGEEFAILLPDTPAGGAWLAVERVRRAIERLSVDVGHERVKVTASFGVATMGTPHASNCARHLMELADKALYRAKMSGRNRVVLAAAESSTAMAVATLAVVADAEQELARRHDVRS